MKALFIGRFQPLHKGHLQLMISSCKEYDELIIGIGSSQYSRSFKNPFTSNERILMIEKSLKKENIKNFKIELLPDIHNYPKWVPYVASIISDFDVVLTNNSLIRHLFEDNGYKVKETRVYERVKYSGKEIRKRISNDEPWEDLVPDSVVKIIKKIDGVKILKDLSK